MVSSFKSGRKRELRISKREHSKGVPLLVEPVFLRELGAGQVDLATIQRDRLFKEDVCTIFEVKSFAHLGRKQRQRLYRSATLISDILDISCRISVIYDDF